MSQKSTPPVDPHKLDEELTRTRVELSVFRQFAIDMVAIEDEDKLFWYIARNVVGQMSFIDCVVYKLDDEQGVLIQMAAIGDKTPEPQTNFIINRLTIPLGQGITGKVAQSQQPTIKNDLSDDPNYINDLMEARSEICVPILHGDRVLGVIDCEHPDADHFQQHHLDMLTSVASLASAQLLQCRIIQEVKETRDALASALEVSRKAQQSQSRFLTATSHELRTPLNAIVGFSDLLATDNYIEENIDNAQDFCKRIKAAGSHLTGIVDDLLNLSAIAGGQLSTKPEAINPRKELEAVTLLAKSGIHTGRLDIRLDPATAEITAWCDRRHFHRILLNLIDNAFKYGSRDNRVIIEVKAQKDKINFHVNDEGIGIEESHLELIFQPFHREAEACALKIDGTGLGLAMARELARTNGGDITVTSTLGKGSRFTLSLKQSAEM